MKRNPLKLPLRLGHARLEVLDECHVSRCFAGGYAAFDHQQGAAVVGEDVVLKEAESAAGLHVAQAIHGALGEPERIGQQLGPKDHADGRGEDVAVGL